MRRIMIAMALSYAGIAQAQTKPDFLAANIDKTMSPATDFFLYANGGWIKRTPIPASESGWGIGNMQPHLRH
jgi:putative endopeptidase